MVVVLVVVGIGVVIVVVVVVFVGVVVVVVVVIVTLLDVVEPGTYQHLSAPAPIQRPLGCRLVGVWVVVMVVVDVLVAGVVVVVVSSNAGEVVDGVPSAWIFLIHIAIAAGSPTCAAIFLHPLLSCASAVMSEKDR